MKNYFFLVLLICFQLSFSQKNSYQEDLISAFDDYAEMDREIVYLHLNKSTYIKGESIGFKAYVLDKNTKLLVNETTNLYCTISDKDDKVIAKKMVMVGNGTAINDFILDDVYTSGEYTIKAYTNWMRNFEEQNFYAQKIKVIDPEIENKIKPKEADGTLDLQLLPEGGHLLLGVNNTIGVIAKNNLGLGVTSLEGSLLDKSNNVVTTFKLNQFGIGKMSFTPLENESYRVKINNEDKDYSFNIEGIEKEGVIFTTNKLKDNLSITFKTNEKTLSKIKNKPYKLIIHNGKNVKETTIAFTDKNELVKAIPFRNLYSGINIITVFNENNKPILERLIFNYEGIKVARLEEPIVDKIKDSIKVSIPISNINKSLFNSLSISVLPENTKAYNHHHNIASYNLLKPYVKNTIEKAHYYFTEVDERKAYDLDNLLLTQGWSSYDWENIFNNPPDYVYDFEDGVSYVANFSNDDNKQLIIYPTLNSPLEIVTIEEEDKSFEKSGFLPISNEKIEIGAVNSRGKPTQPKVFIKFSPDKIPDLIIDKKETLLSVNNFNTTTNNVFKDFNLKGWKKVEQLEEVEISGKKKYTEVEKIRKRTIGKVEFFDEEKKIKYQTLGRYLSNKGFVVLENKAGSFGGFQIYNRRAASHRGVTAPDNIPVIYLDGIILHGDLSVLRDFSMREIDYIEINKAGIGAGMRGGAGVIKIKTNPFKTTKKKPKKIVSRAFEIPLKFDVAKRFYIPKYSTYDSPFFNEYGIIDWFSNVSTDENGTLNLKVFNNKSSNINLYIEGVSNDGTFISEVKTIKID
ncbi:hypothetical protein [uncultured Lacinutrix sp.]|uniref:hypothetical protein n=1 Tax=uncultured Lacinutrix sp. TaxID=574032 RepID=UPI002633395F|nr:hypothetical protein [uncultured Lacinutrix sp.]